MTVLEAVAVVLREAGRPLHPAEITKEILARGLWATNGKTPAATVEARICMAIKRDGDASPIVRVAPRKFALRDSLPDGVIPPSSSPTPPKSTPPPPRSTVSFTDAAERVLEQVGTKRPMHYREITERALKAGLLATEGKTPEATLYSQVLTELKKDRVKRRTPRFVQHGRGFLGLARWMGKGLAFEIEQHNRRVREALRRRLFAMTPDQFERLIGDLLVDIGFEEVEVTGRHGDGGIDVRGVLVVGDVIRTRMAIQAKRWRKGNNVQAPVVQQVRGSLGTHDQGLIITTSDFSPGARSEAERPNAVPVALMNGEQMVGLLAARNIGVSRHSHDILEIEGQDGDAS